MALTWDDISGKTQKHIVPRLVDNVYKSSPVFTRIRTRNAERFEGGLSIRQPIAFAELNGGAFQRGGTFNQMVEKKCYLIQETFGDPIGLTILTKQRDCFARAGAETKRWQLERVSDSPVCSEPKATEWDRNDPILHHGAQQKRLATSKQTRLSVSN